MEDKTVVILGGQRESTHIVYNSLKDEFRIKSVVIEERPSKVQFLKRRVKRLGFLRVLGQAVFQLMAVPYIKLTSHKRISELKKFFRLNDTLIDKSKVINVTSVNSDETMAVLKETNPHIVIVNGTRIISKRILNCIPAKFINMHVGITPLYRGVHGAYWALIENNRKACGVTIHLVDSGIDTGSILEQEVINPTEKDNIVTYPLLQLGAGIPLLKKAVRDISEDRIEIKPYPKGGSRLWSHPTLLGYIWYRACHKIK